MIRLYHHPLSVSSRFIRLILGECELTPELVEERPWERREEFLVMNPAGTLPVLVEDGGPPVAGAWPIIEYLDETRGFALEDRRLLPANADQRAEVRRLCEWFLVKCDQEVTSYLAEEKVIKRERARSGGGGSPDSGLLRAARANIRLHLAYISHLMVERKWLAGDRLTYADLAGAAALFRRRLPRRGSLGGCRRGQGLVCEDEIAGLVQDAARRSGSRRATARPLRRPGLLTPARLRAFLDELATEEGFCVLGVTGPDAIPDAGGRLGQAIADGHHGSMHWLADTAARRTSPSALWSAVRSVAIFGYSYGPEDDPLASLSRSDVGTISVYARNRDYHDVVKGALKRIGSRFAARAGAEIKVFVDTAPVMEKPLAEAAGLGWQGKHTNLVSRDHGSWLFLGAMFTNVELPADTPQRDLCGSCRACLDVCPTDAFPAPYRLDARRCISYLTIEHKGPIDPALRPKMGNRIYGCDDCLAVCPWNKFAEAGRDARLSARADLKAPPLGDLVRLDDAGFRAFFSGSPIKRTGRDRFVRNVLIAIGNSGERSFVRQTENLLRDDSPLVRGAAVWALGRLAEAGEFRQMAERCMPAERDEEVLEEWRQALEQAQA